METRKTDNEEPESQSLSRYENDKTWRGEKPTEKQLAILKNLGYVGPEPQTRGDASDLINEGLEMSKKVPKERMVSQLVFVDVPLLDSKKRTLAQVQINMYLSEGFQIRRDWDYDEGIVMILLKWESKTMEAKS